MADLDRRTASGGLFAIGAQIVKAALHLATLAVLARLLSPEDFGLVAMAATVIAFVGMFTDLGLSAATVQRTEIDQDTVSALFLLNIALGIVVMAMVIALAPATAWFFDDPRIRWVVTALALTIPLMAASRQHAALLQRGMRWVAIQWTAVAAQLVAAMTAIALAWATELGYWALVVQGWTNAVLMLVLLWSVCPWRPSRVRNWRHVRSAVAFGAHLAGFQFVNYFHRQFDDMLIGWRWGAAELGYYTRAYEMLLLPLGLINTPLGSAVIPALSRLQVEPERWRTYYMNALAAVTLVNGCITALLIATAEPLIVLIYGHDWIEAATIFRFLSISIFAATPMNTAGWIYISLGHTRRMMVWGIISTPLIVIALLIGLPFGVSGLALSYSIVICALMLPCFAFAAHGTPLGLRDLLRVVAWPTIIGTLAATCGLIVAGNPSKSYLTDLLFQSVTTITVYTLGALVLMSIDQSYRAFFRYLRGSRIPRFGRGFMK